MGEQGDSITGPGATEAWPHPDPTDNGRVSHAHEEKWRRPACHSRAKHATIGIPFGNVHPQGNVRAHGWRIAATVTVNGVSVTEQSQPKTRPSLATAAVCCLCIPFSGPLECATRCPQPRPLAWRLLCRANRFRPRPAAFLSTLLFSVFIPPAGRRVCRRPTRHHERQTAIYAHPCIDPILYFLTGYESHGFVLAHSSFSLSHCDFHDLARDGQRQKSATGGRGVARSAAKRQAARATDSKPAAGGPCHRPSGAGWTNSKTGFWGGEEGWGRTCGTPSTRRRQ